MKKICHFVCLLLLFKATNAQFTTPLPIPTTLTGTNFSLMLQNGTSAFYTGFNTNTNGYNGNYLGPTLILQNGQNVTMNVMNMLGDTTTTHWHGLHVSSVNDGSPHNLIMDGDTWSPNFTIKDKASTYWYHPHLHGKTLKQVVKGAAGFIIVKDSEESALTLPRNYGTDDFPIAFQFQTFNTTTKQIVLNDELDNAILINGVIQPILNLPAQVVRLRLLNASSHRYINFGFSDNSSFKQIASDAGLLNAPISLTKLQLGSGERAEVLIDLTGKQGTTVYINQFGASLPAGYPGGPPDAMGMTTLGPLDNINFNLIKINVGAPTSTPVTTIPTTLTTNTAWNSIGATTRNFTLADSPTMSMTNFQINNLKYDENVINFNTTQDKVEIWNITNSSMMPHPFHIHGNHFFVLAVNGATPAANLRGRKDVITVPPNNGSVKIITKYEDFANDTMPYMYHCHILSHEDDGMMGQFIVNNSPLDLKLVSFSANYINKETKLFWEVVEQDNVKKFIIQRSYSGNDFIDIGELLATNSVTEKYNYLDKTVLDNLNNSKSVAYRLKIVNSDGKIEFSPVRAINFNNTNTNNNIRIYPNPSNSFINIEVINTLKTIDKIEMLNALGQQVSTTKISNNTKEKIDINNLANGIYIVKVYIDNNVFAQKIKVQH